VPSPRFWVFFSRCRARRSLRRRNLSALDSYEKGSHGDGVVSAARDAAEALRAEIQVPSAAADVAASGTRLPPRKPTAPMARTKQTARCVPATLERVAGRARHSLVASAPAQQVHRWQGAPQAAGHQGRSQERAGHWRREEGAHAGLRWADGASRGRALPDSPFERTATPKPCPPYTAALTPCLLCHTAPPLPPGHRRPARDPQVPEEH
jgi:hypothetical protein